MRKTERELTDVEMIDALLHIVDIIIDDYDREVAPQFRKDSRAAQIGYEIQRFMIEAGIIEPGKSETQRRLEV